MLLDLTTAIRNIKNIYRKYKLDEKFQGKLLLIKFFFEKKIKKFYAFNVSIKCIQLWCIVTNNNMKLKL